MKDKNNTWIWAALIVIILLIALAGPWMLGNFGNFGEWNMMGMMYGGNYGYGMMFFGWIAWILFIGLILAAIYWFVKNSQKSS